MPGIKILIIHLAHVIVSAVVKARCKCIMFVRIIVIKKAGKITDNT